MQNGLIVEQKKLCKDVPLPTREESASSYFLSDTAPFAAENVKEVTGSFVLLHLVPKRQIGMNVVSDASAYSFFGDVSVSFKVSNDIAACLLSDTYRQSNLTNGYSRLSGNSAEDQSMVSKKFPSWHTRTSAKVSLQLSPNLYENFLKTFLKSISANPKDLLTTIPVNV
jgi:hypothetical protein